MCFSFAVIPVKVIIFCVTVTVPETERQFEMHCNVHMVSWHHSPPVPVSRSAAAEVESEVEEAGHHEGRHHHPRVGDHQAHVLKLDLATRARLVIQHSVIIINTLNNQDGFI